MKNWRLLLSDIIDPLLYVFFTLLLFCCPTQADAFKLPDTGQTKCYDEAGIEILCEGTGQDGAYNINPMSYINNGHGTVTDKNTGLMWQKCSVGQQNNPTCSGTAKTFNWYKASGTYDAMYNGNTKDVCGSLTTGGYTDWRLPSKKELISIVDYSISFPGPTLNQAFFPNASASKYWSSTSSAGYTSGIAFSVEFDQGRVNIDFTSNKNNVRCVRGGQSEQTLVDNGNGTVTDDKTGLIWQQDMVYSIPYDDPLSYCQGLSLGDHADWRLPNVKELESLMDDTMWYPTINTTFFPNASAGDYCSSTTNVYYPEYAWFGGFQYGYIGFNFRSSCSPRCVRGGQSRFAAPSAIAAQAVSPTQVIISWNDRTTRETGFDIMRRLGSCRTSNTHPWDQVATVSENTSSYDDSKLLPNTRYSYKIKAHNANGDSNYSKCASVTTPGAALDFPTTLTAVSASASTIQLTWKDNWTEETNFNIYRKKNTDAWTLLNINPMNAASFSDTEAVGNDSETSYSYYIDVCDSAGCYLASNVAVLPYAPTNPRAMSSLGRIDLTWQDNSTNEIRFQIYRKPGGCAAAGTWGLLKTTESNTETYQDTSVTALQSYSYKVRAISKSADHPDATGFSMFTNCVWTKVPIDGVTMDN